MNLAIIQHVSLWLSLLFAFYDVILLFLYVVGVFAPAPEPSTPHLAVMGRTTPAAELRAVA